NGGTTPDAINHSPAAAGTYFVHVKQYSGDTNYTLQLTTDFAGNSLGSARDLGTLVDRKSFSDFVGSIDPNDYYRFSLAGWAGSLLHARLSGLSADADLQLIQDANYNGVVDPGEVLASSTYGSTWNEDINPWYRLGGTYYVRVYQFSGDTN